MLRQPRKLPTSKKRVPSHRQKNLPSHQLHRKAMHTKKFKSTSALALSSCIFRRVTIRSSAIPS